MKPSDALEPLLTAKEAGAILRCSAQTVRRLPIRSVPIGTGRKPRRMYRREDIQAFIEEKVA